MDIRRSVKSLELLQVFGGESSLADSGVEDFDDVQGSRSLSSLVARSGS